MVNKTISNITSAEAYDQALSLLKTRRKEGEGFTYEKKTSYSVSYKEPPTILNNFRGTGRNEEEQYCIVTDTKTGAKVLYYRPLVGNAFHFAYFEPEEWGNYTYPFKNLQEEQIFVALHLNACFIKPVKILSPDEANTPTGHRILDVYFGYGNEKEDFLEKNYTTKTAFYKENSKVYAICTPPDYVLEEVTGVTINNAEAYANAVAKYLNAPLSKEQRESLNRTYAFDTMEYFVKWNVYEFMRTEEYSHLQDSLSKYKAFNLSKEWAKDLCYLNGMDPEEYVIAKYLSKDAIKIVGNNRQRELSEYTGTPLSLIIKGNKRRIWDF